MVIADHGCRGRWVSRMMLSRVMGPLMIGAADDMAIYDGVVEDDVADVGLADNGVANNFVVMLSLQKETGLHVIGRALDDGVPRMTWPRMIGRRTIVLLTMIFPSLRFQQRLHHNIAMGLPIEACLVPQSTNEVDLG